MTKFAWLRVVLAFLIAPLVPGIGTVLLKAPGDLLASAPYILTTAFLSYPPVLIVGLPLFILFRSRGWVGLLTFIVAGILLGLVVFVWATAFAAPDISQFYEMIGGAFQHANLFVMLEVPCGAVSGLLFWLIARPDRSAPTPAKEAD